MKDQLADKHSSEMDNLAYGSQPEPKEIDLISNTFKNTNITLSGESLPPIETKQNKAKKRLEKKKNAFNAMRLDIKNNTPVIPNKNLEEQNLLQSKLSLLNLKIFPVKL